MFGTGFWSRYQLSAWRELSGVECVALYNRTRSKAEALGRDFGIEQVFDDPEELLRTVDVDFVDIVTDINTHRNLALLAAEHGKDAICQKPMAPTLADAEAMRAGFAQAGKRLFIHENWRWQSTARALKEALDSGVIGNVFRAGIDMNTGFPVFEAQPFLRELEHFIISDLGSHTLDVARFLFGEAHDLTCWSGRVQDIRGEDHATIVMRMGEKEIPVTVRMAYAGNALERECFPETLYFVEGSKGSIEVAPGLQLRITTADGTQIRKAPPPHHDWADPRYALAHASIVPCNANLLSALRGEGPGETTADDNIRTVRLVHAAYESAKRRQTVALNGDDSFPA
jgi:predicted dehydrogenase